MGEKNDAMSVYLRLLAEQAQIKVEQVDAAMALPTLVPLGFDADHRLPLDEPLRPKQ